MELYHFSWVVSYTLLKFIAHIRQSQDPVGWYQAPI
jgi:hypothetical protein